MLTSDFNYFLPPELIAYYPTPERGASRMLVLERNSGRCEIRKFKDILDYLNPGDCVVRNNSKVLKARLYASPICAPEKKTEFFLIQAEKPERKIWTALAKPRRNLKKFTEFIALAPDGRKYPKLMIRVLSFQPLKIAFESECDNLQNLLDLYGHIPLPPYIKRPDQERDKERYQTIYAKEDGSLAAPTAGLHFTEEIFRKMSEKNISIADITLHVGTGTFQPVRTEKISEHKMHSEFFYIPESEADKINDARNRGAKILALGTTSLRAMESSISSQKKINPSSGETNIFIYPGYHIKSADMLFTNFHLPKSTLLMLVSAFAGRKNILNAYQLAIREKFRFYSYGDCMLIK